MLLLLYGMGLINSAVNNNTTIVCNITVVMMLANHQMNVFVLVNQAKQWNPPWFSSLHNKCVSWGKCSLKNNALLLPCYSELRIYNILSGEMETLTNLIVIAWHCISSRRQLNLVPLLGTKIPCTKAWSELLKKSMV